MRPDSEVDVTLDAPQLVACSLWVNGWMIRQLLISACAQPCQTGHF